MNVILIGAPGSGKGTQAKLLEVTLRAPQVSTGDMLRAAIREQSPLGMKAEPLMKAGSLVPDEIVLGLVRERLAKPDCATGSILDGFPRTIPQATELDAIMRSLGKAVERVVLLDVPAEVIVDRVEGRRSCPNDGEVFHVRSRPPRKAGVCDACGGNLVQRPDDNADAVRRRLSQYAEQTSPLLDFYEKRGLLRRVNGVGTTQAVTDAVLAAVKV